MAYECRVERDSISPEGNRATTFVVTFPRIVLAEFVTHRTNSDNWGYDCSVCERTTTPDISKNSASSRAIPFQKMLAKVQKDPFMPFWTLNEKGMQGSLSEDPLLLMNANSWWITARDWMITAATKLHDLGIHKQDCNRLLEPWGWVTQVITSSNWDNFFALRCHKAAHPAFRHIARMMYLKRRKSTPIPLKYGQWHLPFVSMEDQTSFRWEPKGWNYDNQARKYYVDSLHDLIKMSAARCAWVSYENHDKDASPDAHFKTFDRLMAEIPVHASPIEHQLTPMDANLLNGMGLWSNITGFLQARKLVKMENITKFDPSEEEIRSWGL